MESTPRITNLVDSTAIWIVPVMNPDDWLGDPGTTLTMSTSIATSPPTQRLHRHMFDGEPLGDGDVEPETAAVMRWTADNSFTLSRRPAFRRMRYRLSLCR